MRISTQELLRIRRDRSSTILITGGTGFLGSHIVARLLRDGYRVLLLVRSSKQLPAPKRVAQLLDWFGMDGDEGARLRVIEGVVDEPNLGMNKAEYDALCAHVQEIIHCASNTSFSERKRKSVEKVNIDGLRNMLSLAARSGCFFFHHVSTAYVAGKREGVCREEQEENDRFTNVYEETKYHGEKMVSEECGPAGIRLSVYRPSIVYGDSKTGRGLKFNAVYYPIRMVLLLKSLYEADIRERGGRKAAQMGVRLEADGSIYLPMTVEVKERGGVNLIPIDYFVEAFAAIMEELPDGGIFHIVNDRLKRIEDLIDYTKKMFRIRGLEPCRAEELEGKPRNALELIFDTYIEVYGPYMRDTRVFENDKTRLLLSERDITCPDFDFEVFSRCMMYGIETGWGTRLFARETLSP